MAKFDFNNSRYAKLFGESNDVRFLQTFIDNTALLQVNYGWWKTQARKADQITPTAPDGTSTFTAKAIKNEISPLMDMRSRLGDTMPLDRDGLSFYSATIPDFASPGIVETALERESKEEQFRLFGNDADIISAWIDKVQDQYDSANATLTYLTAQLLSKGEIVYDAGRGIHAPLHQVPQIRKVNAGSVVWSDPSCPLLDQMAQIEQEHRESTGYNGTLVWKIPFNLFKSVFMANAQVKKWIADTRTYNEQATTNAMVVPMEDVVRYISAYPGLSPIEIVKDKVRNLTQVSDTLVNGWVQTNAVLCPAGYVAEIQYTDQLERKLFDKYGANTIVKVYATLEDGLFNLVNTTLPNGNYKEWHTDLFMSCVPSMIQFPYHCIVDTTQANG